MYFVPYVLFIKGFDAGFVAGAGDKVQRLDVLTWSNFLINNLIPVTIGNIIGDAVLVAAVLVCIPSQQR
mgnify:CR=1 FL=1